MRSHSKKSHQNPFANNIIWAAKGGSVKYTILLHNTETQHNNIIFHVGLSFMCIFLISYYLAFQCSRLLEKAECRKQMPTTPAMNANNSGNKSNRSISIKLNALHTYMIHKTAIFSQYLLPMKKQIPIAHCVPGYERRNERAHNFFKPHGIWRHEDTRSEVGRFKIFYRHIR